jgi:hypothetical protein
MQSASLEGIQVRRVTTFSDPGEYVFIEKLPAANNHRKKRRSITPHNTIVGCYRQTAFC